MTICVADYTRALQLPKTDQIVYGTLVKLSGNKCF
jgi:hypothetical protein